MSRSQIIGVGKSGHGFMINEPRWIESGADIVYVCLRFLRLSVPPKRTAKLMASSMAFATKPGICAAGLIQDSIACTVVQSLPINQSKLQTPNLVLVRVLVLVLQSL